MPVWLHVRQPQPYSSSYGRRGVRSEITRYQRSQQHVLTLLKYPSVSERRQQRPKGGECAKFQARVAPKART